MKYLIEAKGLDWFKAQVEAVYGAKLLPPRNLVWHSSSDHLGRHVDENGKGYLGLFIASGRIRDTDEVPLKTVLREIVQTYRPVIRLTTQQNLLLTELSAEALDEVEQKLRSAGIPLASELPPTRLASMSCVALPTCGLAIAESERVFPAVVRQFESALDELGLGEESISVRMTGCPNGCARPYIGEIGFVGRALGKYDVFLGANAEGTRMNQLYKEMVPLDKLVDTVRPLLKAYAEERLPNERFGDFCHRVGLERLRELESISVG